MRAAIASAVPCLPKMAAPAQGHAPATNGFELGLRRPTAFSFRANRCVGKTKRGREYPWETLHSLVFPRTVPPSNRSGQRKSREKRLSLVELRVVIAIVDSLSALTMSAVTRVKNKADSATCLNHLKPMRVGRRTSAQECQGCLAPALASSSRTLPSSRLGVTGQCTTNASGTQLSDAYHTNSFYRLADASSRDRQGPRVTSAGITVHNHKKADLVFAGGIWNKYTTPLRRE